MLNAAVKKGQGLETKIFSKKEVRDILDLLKLLFNKTNNEGYIRILNNGKGIYKDYKVKDLVNFNNLEALLNGGEVNAIDLFYSVNTYNQGLAITNNMFQIVNILLDVDYTGKGSLYNKLSNKEFISLMEHDVFGQAVPTPTAAIFTGNNVHLIYKLKYSVNATDKAKMLARRIQKHLISQLQEFKPDKGSNLTTLTRFIGSYNAKNMGLVSAKTYGNEYELRELQEWLPPLPEWYEKWKKNKGKKKKKCKVTNLNTIYSMLHNRIQDMENLQAIRGYRCYGYREVMCFLYRNFVIQAECDPEVAEERMLDFNSRFEKPLIPRRIESKTRIVERHTYKYRSTTIVDLLDITEQEQKQMVTIIGKVEKNERRKATKKINRRNEEGLTKREAEKLEKVRKIRELKKEGLSYSKIAKQLDISINTVKKYSSKYITNK